MVDIIKQDMTDIWAVAGDVVAPDSAKVRAGWAVEAVPRQWWNFIENRQDSNISYMLQKGIPEWDAFTEYLNVKSYVQRNGIIYKSIQTGTNQDPASAPTYWIKAFAESSASLEALKALTPAADRLPYFNGASTAALTTLSSFARTLLDDTSASAMRTTIDAQQADLNLTALSAVTPNTNVLPYFNSTTTMTGTPLTAFGRSLIDDVDAAAGRATLGLGTISTYDVTTSTTDNTANRISKVGDFGENGGDPLSQGSGVDANSLTVSGTYIFPSGGINLPIAAAFYLKHISYPVAGYAKQFAWNITTNTGYMRTQQATVWSAWAQDASFDDVDTALNAQNAASGINTVAAPLATNLNNILTTGVQRFTGSATNTPISAVGTVFTMSYDSLYKTQIVQTVDTGSGGNRTFWRTLNNGTWGSWQEAITATALTAALVPYALKGANSDITSLSGLTTALSVAQGGTGTTTSTGTGSVVRSISPTFTGLPLAPTAAPGTNTTQLATTAFVTAGLALKQASLGFTPVQQGTGVGQTTNVVKIGWSVASKLKATVDSTDLGNIALESYVTTYVPSYVTSVSQTSAVDATLGRLMGVGAFGLGANGNNVPSTSNITATINVGFYKFSGGVTGAPPQFAGAGGSLIVHSLGGNFLQQIAISIPGALDNPLMVMRHYDTTGNPGAWVRMMSNAMLVGTVSVTGTLPTGTIFETQTNANGTYTKFTDGTLINIGPIADFAVGAGSLATVSPNGTFAHPFIDSNYFCHVLGTPSGSNDQYGFTSVNNRATTAVNFVHRNGASAQSMVNLRFTAIGRWY